MQLCKGLEIVGSVSMGMSFFGCGHNVCLLHQFIASSYVSPELGGEIIKHAILRSRKAVV